MLLQVIQVSTRPSRASDPIAKWMMAHAEAHKGFTVEFIDLRAEALPVFDEPQHPRLRQYEHEHTKRWSAKIERADAFVWVTPEYNFATPVSLLNALTYLVQEWAYKPAALVSYGGVSAGTRGVQMTKQTLTALGVMPIPQAVAIPFFTQHIKDGKFEPGETQDKAAGAMLTELGRWAVALATLRTPAK
ncbi:NAD(P)H-dependent oxidoreductase [soil metagenome]